MADKTISQLTEATSILDADLFVLEQSSQAKKLTGATLKQNLVATYGGTCRNLLDNPWFTVNQRGVTTLPANGYFVDRWMTYSAVGTVNANGVSLSSGNIYQKLEPDLWTSLIGKPLTASLLLSGGTISSASITNFSGNDVSFPGGVFSLTSATKAFNVYTDGTIRAVKLEIGTVATLANDVAPDYTTELLKCQRYFYRLSASGRGNLGFCQIAATTQAIFFGIHLPAGLRVAVSTDDGFSASSQDCIGASIVTGASAIYCKAISVYDCWAGNTNVTLRVNFNSGQLTTSAAYALFLAGQSYLDFSADL